jgi:sugar phosphate isomerase/epimerase
VRDVRVGFNNACLPGWDLARTFTWAAEHDWAAVELHGGKRYSHIDWKAIAAGRENPIAEEQARTGVAVAGIMHGLLPFLSLDPREKEMAATELETLLLAAKRSEIPVVSTFTGRDPSKTLEESVELLPEVFGPLLRRAEELDVKLAFENCPMYEFWPHDANVAVAPSLWQAIFDVLPSPQLGLNLDPSHLVWQGIDVVRSVREFGSKIWLVQAKDTETLRDVLEREGMLTLRWWRHRLPGHGELDWVGFLSALREVAYQGPVIIEHEDPLWLADEDSVVEGLTLARAFLERAWGPSKHGDRGGSVETEPRTRRSEANGNHD